MDLLKTLIFLLINICVAQCMKNSRMLTGEEVPIESVPFQGLVETMGPVCSAAILSSKYILLTANCAEDFNVNLDIVTFRFGTPSRRNGGEKYSCINLYEHPKFDVNNSYALRDYDVAVAEVFPELKLNDLTIKPIQLADKAPSVTSNVQISGWGPIKDGGAQMVYVRATNVTITDSSSCKSSFDGELVVTDRMICGGKVGVGVACEGELGSLLTQNGKLVGLYSGGNGCGQTGRPDVYVNLANTEIRSFIKQITGL